MRNSGVTTIIILLCLVQSTFAYNYISWQAQKGEGTYWCYVGIDVDDVSGIASCHLKGPNMGDYTAADWDAGRTQWFSRIFYSTVNELQLNSVGTWLVRIIYDDTSESIYTFTISGLLEENDFPPVPTIIEPAEGASNIIAEDYDLTWNSNGADLEATMLAVEVGGNDFFYYSYDTEDLSYTTWQPGWLEIGEAFLGISYMINHTLDMFTSYPELVSGPPILWARMAIVGSGVKNDFTVKYSLDFNDDDRINLIDFVVLANTWMLVSGDTGYNDHCDLIDDGIINLNDLAVFYDNWLEIGPINNHVLEIEIGLSNDYGEGYPGGVPVLVETEFDGWMQVDDTVISGTIETPGGVIYPCEEENDDGENWLGVSASSLYSENFSDFTFGTYIFTVNYNDGASASTEIDFEFSDGATMPPCPIVNSPVHNAVNVTANVEFQMSEICNPLWTYAIDCFPVDDIGLEDEVENIPTCGTTALGPLALSDGVEYEAEVTINNAIWSTNKDGIPYVIDKDSEVEIIFTTDSE